MEKETIINFCGSVHYEVIGELIHELKQKSQIMGIKTSIYKKILLVMIEALENIIKYNEYPVKYNGNINNIHPRLKIEKEDELFRISSSNLLNNSHKHLIEDKINYLNTLDQQGLKDHYKSVITNGEFSQKGGAGLGLIEMAKISNHKIACNFSAFDKDYSRYKLKVIIAK